MQEEALRSFRWWVPPQGFVWVRKFALRLHEADGVTTPIYEVQLLEPEREASFAGDEELLLIPSGPPPSASWTEHFPLREYPGLFRETLDVGLTEAAIRGFANRFGLPTIGHKLVFPPWDHPRLKAIEEAEPAGALVYGDRLATLKETFREFHYAVRLWELWKEARQSESPELRRQLREQFDWNTERAIFPPDPDLPSRSRFQLTPADLSAVAQVGPDSAFEMTPVFLERIVIWNLENIPRRATSMPELSGAHQIIGEEVVVLPSSLRTALWHQFANAFLKDKEYRLCANGACKRRWFEVRSAHGAIFCSDACRHKVYRDRKNQARELKSGGKSLGDIAKTVGSDVETIRGWVRTKPRRAKEG